MRAAEEALTETRKELVKVERNLAEDESVRQLGSKPDPCPITLDQIASSRSVVTLIPDGFLIWQALAELEAQLSSEAGLVERSKRAEEYRGILESQLEEVEAELERRRQQAGEGGGRSAEEQLRALKEVLSHGTAVCCRAGR